MNNPISGSDEIAQLDRAFHSTAEKLAEARRKERAVFDNSRNLIATLDPQFKFLSCNPAAERLLGVSRDELLRKSITDLVIDSEKDREGEKLADLAKKGELNIEIQVPKGDGSIMHLLCSLSCPQAGENVYCVAHDISARKQLEQLKQEFLAVVSHDLRNPLGSVVGFVTLIKAGALGTPGKDTLPYLNSICEEADKLLLLINDLLDLEKLEAQSMQLDKEVESVGKVAYLAFEAIQSRYPGYELDFTEDSDEIDLLCDTERLGQAIGNIFAHICSRSLEMHNAAADSKTLRITLRSSEEGAIISITCLPPPYDEAEKEHLFERFKTVKLRTCSSLSLPIAKSIIEAHGGTLQLSGQKTSQSFIVAFSAAVKT